MGAYLSEPLTEKASSDESNDYLACGLSSMQGWRMTQEDAHNAVLDFDEGTSFFAVYDGHGGHEVAAYCAEHLPKFLKDIEDYKKGEVIEALKQAFLKFDETLTKLDVITILKELAGNKDDDQSTDDDDENMSNLHAEASMPIEQLLAKYQSEGVPTAMKKLKDGNVPASPYLKARKGSSSSSVGCSSSSDGPSASSSGSGSGCSSSSTSDQVSSSSTHDSAGPSNSSEVNSSDDVPDTQTASPDVGSSGDVKEKEEKSVGSSRDVKEALGEAKKDIDSAVSSGSSGSSSSQQNGAVDSTDKKEVNGDVNHDTKQESDSSSRNDDVSSSSPSKEVSVKNGDVSSPSQDVKVKGKGKAKDKSPRPDPEAKEDPPAPTKSQRPTRISTLQLYRSLIKAHGLSEGDDDDSEDTEDEDDTTFDGGVPDSSDEDVDGEEDEDEEEEEEDDEEEDEEDDSMDEEEEECEDFAMGSKEEPGADSGCTAVVALLKGRDLYVANAGDSRCVVCRNGTAIEMSLDHKPEDPLEWQRILHAGGKVTCDGRVNGGLNLSRAIGDHAYKQNKDITATEQMITALPDVRTLRINPDVDEFMVLACDGIWNYLSSQDVVDFVRKRILEGKLKISQICEELFDHCLAPNTLGDGTGCDNMTAVIVRFRPELSKLPVTLTHDSVFDEPVKNEKVDNDASNLKGQKVKAEDTMKEVCEAGTDSEAKRILKPGVEQEVTEENNQEVKKEVKQESSDVPSEEVSTSNSLKRAASSNDVDGSNGADHPEKKMKTESGDSEAVAVEV